VPDNPIPQHDLLPAADPDAEISLLEILDSILNTGVVIQGSVIISLAGVDLIYLGMNVVLTSVETAIKHLEASGIPHQLRGRR
jgi:hypothetical protein